jgi:hypothetical protein
LSKSKQARENIVWALTLAGVVRVQAKMAKCAVEGLVASINASILKILADAKTRLVTMVRPESF